jgi:hypothetical protein
MSKVLITAAGGHVIEEALAALGIETRLGAEIVAMGPSGVTLKSGEEILAATVVGARVCAPIRSGDPRGGRAGAAAARDLSLVQRVCLELLLAACAGSDKSPARFGLREAKARRGGSRKRSVQRHLTGTTAGAPLSLIKTTRNLAGLVLLAFRSTT